MYLDQEQIGRACVCIAKAMKSYASTGADDYQKVGEMMKEVLEIMADKLTPNNQNRLTEWLIRKTEEMKEAI